MNHEEWLRSLPGAPSITSAARTAGIQKTTLLRQLERGGISAENVIALARAHGESPVDALVDTEHLQPDELTEAGVPQALGHATNQQLLEEIRRRVDPEAVRLLRGGGGISPRFKPVPTLDVTAAAMLPEELGLAARRTGQRKGADPRGLDDGEE